jgi:hypothetical protein
MRIDRNAFVAASLLVSALGCGSDGPGDAGPEPTPACVYRYTEWSECDLTHFQIQSRNVVSVAPAGCIGNPILTQHCELPPCVPIATLAGPPSGFSVSLTGAGLPLTVDCPDATFMNGSTDLMTCVWTCVGGYPSTVVALVSQLVSTVNTWGGPTVDWGEAPGCLEPSRLCSNWP